MGVYKCDTCDDYLNDLLDGTYSDGSGWRLQEYSNDVTNSLANVSLPNSTQISSIAPGETQIVYSSHTITQSDLDTGGVSNTVTITAEDQNISDISDDGDDTDGELESDPTITLLDTLKEIEVIKTAVVEDVNSNGLNDEGDIITYTITVTNNGNVTLSNIDISDQLTDAEDNSLTLTSGPTYVSSCCTTQLEDLSSIWANNEPSTNNNYNYGIVNLQTSNPGIQAKSTTSGYTFIIENDLNEQTISGFNYLGSYNNHSYFKSQSNAISFENAMLIAESKENSYLWIIDSVEEWETIQSISGDPGSTGTNHWIGLRKLDDIWQWIGKDSNETASADNVNFPFTDVAGSSVLDDNTIEPQVTDIYTATYTIEATAIASGVISNSVTVTGSSPANTGDVTDVSDDDDDTDGNLEDDSTDITSPYITVTKTAVIEDTNSDEFPSVGDTINYTITVENTGGETLSNMTLVDTLTDANASVLSLTTQPTFVSSTLNSEAGTLLIDEIATYSASYIITQEAFDSGSILNSVVATATGLAEIAINDTSDNGDDTDGNTEDDQTIVEFGSIKVVKTAVVTDNNNNELNDLGDTIAYTITIQNTGNITLTNPVLVDVLTDSAGNTLVLNSGPTFISSTTGSSQNSILADGILTYSATHQISSVSDDTAFISNTVTVTASSPGYTNDISDISDDGDDTDGNTEDDETKVVLAPDPEMEITKTYVVTDNNNNGLNDLGDGITYTITVKNTGNLNLTGLILNDILTDYNGNVLSLQSGPNFVSADQSSEAGTLLVGETATFTAFYAIEQTAVDNGGVKNTVIGTASSPGYTNDVTDTSDDGDDTDGNTIDDQTEIIITPLPSLEVTKTVVLNDLNSNGFNDIGDRIDFIISVENNGNIILTDLNLLDTFTDHLGNSFTLSDGPTFVSSTMESLVGTLQAGEIANYLASFIIDQAAVDIGSLNNSVLATASSPGNTDDVTDISDDGDDADGNIEDDDTVVDIYSNSLLEVVKIANVTDSNDNKINDIGDIINYTISVTNTGNTNLTGVNLVDTITNSIGTELVLNSSPGFINSSQNSTQGTILIGETATYTASFIINDIAFNSEYISNSVTAYASSEGLTDNVTDISDDGDDTDGNTTNDPTITFNDPTPSIEATKTFEVIDNGDGLYNSGDIIKYTITFENTGNAPLTGLNFTDNISDGTGTVLSLTDGPFYSTSSLGSAQGSLNINEIATYIAFYTINNSSAESGSVINSVTVNASSPGNTNDVTDISDDGDDTDGNTTNDPTILNITSNAAIKVVKTAVVVDNNTNDVIDLGDTINYTISVTNNGEETLTGLFLTDLLTDGNGQTLTLSVQPTYQSSTLGSSSGNLLPSEQANYTAAYIITQSDVDSGLVRNSVLATASSQDGTNNISDVSDDGDDTDGNTTDDPTDIILTYETGIEVVKTSTISDNGDDVNGLGDTITYTIQVTNTGNVLLTDVIIVDTLTDANGNALTLSSGPNHIGSTLGSSDGVLQANETATYIAFYVIGQTAVDNAGVSNTVTATGSSPGNSDNVTDVSDDGDDTDGNTSDDSTDQILTKAPSINVTKTATVVDNNNNEINDFGDTINYTILVMNTGNVSLSSVTINDVLTNADGTALSLTTGPSFVSSNQNSTEGTLKVGETSTYNASYTIQSIGSDSGSILNTVTATASSPDNTSDISDISDNGDDTDGNLIDDSTEVITTAVPSMEVTKTYSIIGKGDEGYGIGDIIQYNITVENTGNVSLSSISLNDTLSDANGVELTLTNGPFFSGSNQQSGSGTLKVGETATYIAFYVINQAVVDAGGLSNTVTVTASSPGNTEDIIDISDDGDDTDGNTTDDPTEYTFTAQPSIEAIKTATVIDNGDNINGPGDTIQYTISIINTGNVTLTDVSINDILTDANELALTLTSGPGLTNSSQNSVAGTLIVGETATYTATYLITDLSASTGSINNSVVATASSPNGTDDVTDESDNGNDTDGNTVNDSTTVLISSSSSLEVTKTAIVVDNGDNVNGSGDTITYTITVENTGNTILTGVGLVDTLTDGNNAELSLTSGPSFSGNDGVSNEGTLKVGETATYTATYLITDLSASTGSINNSVVAAASSPNGTNDVTDESDNGNDTDGNAVNDATTVLISSSSSIEVTKTAIVVDNGDNVNGSGDTITYTITAENTGNTILTGVGLVDTLTDGNNAELSLTSGPLFSGNDGVSNEGTLKVGETATYTATYLITDLSSVTGSINNSVVATASSPNGTNDVTDVSDNGNDTDGNTINDITTITTSLIASIEVTKTATVVDNGDNVNGIGDVINYSITVENNGSVSLTGISLSDTFLDGDGNALTIVNPAFVSSTQGSVSGILLAGEVATYSTSYTIIEQTADTGFVSNSVTAIASTVNGTNDVSDVSDDGDDTDGNTTNDPTITVISSNASIEVTKTATIIDNGDELTGAGDIIQYTISVKNTGNIILTNLGIVDILTDGDGESLSITNGPFFSGSNQGSAAGTLQVGEVATYIAYYTITSPASQTGSIINTATATASSPGKTNDVTDISDDGDDTDGNTSDDTTDVIITPNPIIEVTKTAELVDNGDGINGSGDTITYTIAVENIGNVALSGLALNDTITDADGNALILNSGPSYSSSDQTSAIGTLIIGETETYTATYIISSTAANTGGVYNSVTATATSPGNTNDVTDISDDGDDTDGNTSDDTTNIETNSSPSIQVTKTATIVDNGDGQTGLGDTINYAITVENTGNVSLTELSLVDTLTDGNGNAIDLSSGLSFESSSLGSANGILQLAEVATYSASYVISEATEDTGFISNTVLATASSPDNTNDITDISDDGDDTDGNTIDDPTIITTSANPSIEVVKFSEIIDNGDLGLGIGDIIKYTIYLENTGNVDLSEVSIVDTLSDFNNAELSITNGPYYSGSDTGASQGNLVVGDVATYIAFYTISQQSIDAGGVSNSVTVTASSPGNTNDVTDISDDGDDTDGNTEDDPTEISIDTAPAINVVKTAVVTDNGDGYNGAGDVISYTITVANTGNVTLSGLTLEDTLTDADGNTLSLSSGPSYSRSTQSNAQGTLDVDEVETYVATYLITQTASDTQSINNTVLAKISSPNGTDDVSDRSDDGDDTDGNTEDDPTVVITSSNISIEVTKTAIITDNNDDGENNAGDLINYTITVENTGLVNLTNLALTDTLLDGNSVGLPLTTGPTFSNASLGSPQGSIAAGEVVTYLATYTIEQAVSNTGLISNSVTAIASSPGNNGDVTDISDDGDDTDGNTEDDPTLVQTAVASSINVTKTVTVIENGDGLLGLGDTVVYTIRVKNTGSASITGVTLEDTFTDINENTLSLTTPVAFDFGNLGSSEGNLLVGETAHYTATFVLDQSIIDIGGLINQVLATGSSPTGTQVIDVSDDGDDTDGNTEDDPTLLIVNPNPIIETTKTASINDNGDGELGLGDTIEYTITVENLGNVTLSGLTLEDTLTDGQDNTLTLTSGPSFESSTMNSLAGGLQVGEMVTYLATYVIDQAAVDSGQVMNTVFSTASTPNGTDDVTDRSDDGDDTDGETEDDETVTLIPQSPSIEVTKTAIITDNNDDGENNAGDLINYTITVENTGLVNLTNLALTDTLLDGNSVGLPLTTGPTFSNASLGSPQGSIAAGEVVTYLATYTIEQAVSNTGLISNSVTAIASSPGNNGDVTDISDDGDDTDGNTEDDPTLVQTAVASSINVTKTVTVIENGDGLLGLGDTVVYTIRVKNTGSASITGVTLEDTFTDINENTLSLTTPVAFDFGNLGSSEGNLLVGETAHYTATFVLDQSIIDIGGLINQVLATGSSPTGTQVIDVSDDGDDTDGNTEDDPTLLIVNPNPIIETTKTASINDNGDGELGLGDTIEYTITVENLGNVTLSGLTLEDTLTDGQDNTLTLTSGPSFESSTMNSLAGGLQVGEMVTYLATYVIDQAAVDSGQVMNTVFSTASTPNGTDDVTDRSDDGDDTDGETEDDETVTLIPQSSSIEVTKTAIITDNNDDGENNAGDLINYTITVENTGDVTLTGLILEDVLTDGQNNALNITSGPIFVTSDQGTTEGSLAVGETATYSATYVIDQIAVDSGQVMNSVLAVANNTLNTEDITDISDDGDDTDGNTEDDPTVTTISQSPSIEVTKLATLKDNGDDVVGTSDIIEYTITVENTGDVTIDNLSLEDTLSDGQGNTLTLSYGLFFSGSDQNSSEGTIQVGETATYIAYYIIEQLAADSGNISNTVTATASSPTGTDDVTDISDDGDDTDGNTEDDSTDVLTDAISTIEVTKTATITDNGDGFNGSGDIIEYTISVENTGNVTIDNINLEDTLTDGDGNSLSLSNGPFFAGSDQNSPDGTIQVGETATYIAYYVIDQSAADSGSIVNTAKAKGNNPNETEISDVSDDGDDTDGNTEDDPTVVITEIVPSIKVTKTATITDNGDGLPGVGDTINYTITVENTGSTILEVLGLVDTLSDISGNSLTLTTGPIFAGSNQGSTPGTLQLGETATYVATYIIDAQALEAGGVSNTVTATASSPTGTEVSDVSDDGDDTDGNTSNDPTVIITTVEPSIEVTKTATITDNGDGITGLEDVINYTITVENTGNTILGALGLVDTLSDISGNSLTLTTGPIFSGSNQGSSQGTLQLGETATYVATYVIDAQALEAGGVSNTVTAAASSPTGTEVSDVSDNGDDTDGNTSNDPTVVTTTELEPSIEVTKTATITDNNEDGENNVGDAINYTITVENTGNTTLAALGLVDTLSDISGNSLTLTTGPIFSGSNQGSTDGTLAVGETATYVATYVIDAQALEAGGVSNTVTATASSLNGTDDVSDRSDDGDDTDGNTEDDPTVVITSSNISIEVTKTAIITDNNDDGENNAGDLINYTITVENTGLVNLTNLALTDTLLDGNSVGLTLTTGPTFSNASLGSPQGSIAAGEVVTYLATYTIEQAVSNTGLISNSVTAIASSPGNNGDVTDISDDGDDTDGNTEDDPTLVQTAVASSINVTKTVTVIENGDGLLGLGDTVVYTIRVKNTGSASITGVTLEDTFTDINENTLSLTTPVAFDFGNLGSSEGNLLVGETAHYTATFVLDQSIIDIGGLINQVLATGSSPTGTQVIDVSDDGDDTDGNTEDDPTLLIVNPNPIIETTKTASINDNGDGELGLGDTIEYTITVENLGNVTLSGLTLEDTLTDGQDNTLTLTSGPSFESSTMNSLAGGLQVGEMVTYLATYVIDQAAVDSGQVMNTVFSTASTPNGTDDVTDRSDDGDDTDGETEDDETVTLIPQSPSIEVTKTAIITDNNDDGENNAGDLINYTITVENTGDVTLTGLILEDVLTDGQNNALNITSGPIFVTSDQGTTEGSLAVGETATYSATYVIDQIAVDSGQVMNSVLAVANNTLNTEDITDISDDGDDTDGNTEDDPTVTTISQSPSIEVTKLATLKDNGDDVVGTSDIIEYTITVENTGDVTIDNLSLEDTLSDGQGNTLTLSYGLFFSGSDQNSSEGTIQVGETATYIAYYIIEQLAADSGNISNTVTATGSSPTGTDDVTDISDDGDDTDGNTEDDSTDVLTDAISTIEVTKTATITDNGDGFNGSGDIIEYTISVENTGNVTIDNINLEDTLTDGDGNSLSLSNGPFFAGSDQNSPDGTIQVGETATYIAYYVIDQSAADSGSIVNTAKAKGNNPNETEISDVSDDGDDTDGNTEDDPTVVTTKELEPSIEVTKTATITDNGDGITGLEDVINYTITVENTGSTILEALGLVDTLSDISGNSLTLTTGPIFSGSNQGSTDGTLAVGETATYVATYVINAQAAEAGGVSNTVTAAAISPTGTEVSDVSDDGDDTDGNTSNDPTVIITTAEPSIEVTKTAIITDNGDGITGLEDVINYTITVENTGNTILGALGLVDTLSDISGNSLTLTTGPIFSGSNQGSSQGTLQLGETATYVATYVINAQAAEAGGVSNTVTAAAISPTGTEVSDVSDDGDDTDGNTSNDPTVVTTTELESSIEVTKTATITDNNEDGKNNVGDTINYTITVENTGNTTLAALGLVDTLSDISGNSLTLTTGPIFSGSNQGSTDGTLAVGETATYVATYVINAQAAEAGGVSNTVTAAAISPTGTEVSDVSDDGDDTDGNTSNDPTVVTTTELEPSIEVTKTATITDNNEDGKNNVGDTINYTITVENTGNTTLAALGLVDTLSDISGNSLTLTTGPIFSGSNQGSTDGTLAVGETATYVATYVINAQAAEVGGVSNTVTAAAISPTGTEVSDVSDDGDDIDGNTSNDPTITELYQEPVDTNFEIFNGITPNNDGNNDYFKITGIEYYPNNNVKIFNRWGVLVYETENYGIPGGANNLFVGISEGRITYKQSQELPTGTYFYIISFQDSNPGQSSYKGYMYINRD